MSYEISLAHLTVLSLSPVEMIEMAARTGYQYVSIRLKPVAGESIVDLIDNKENLRQVKACLERENIRVHDIELVRLPPECDPTDFLPLLQTGAELGARSVMVQIPDGDRSRAAEHFQQLCDLAAPLGLNADLEFLPWFEISDLEAAAHIVRAAARSNAGILIDTLHFSRSNSQTELLKSLPKEWFNFIQLCDASDPIPTTEEAMIDVARGKRLFPGEGDIDLRSIVENIPKVPYSLEIPNHDQVKKLGLETFCRQAREETEKFLDTCHFSN